MTEELETHFTESDTPEKQPSESAASAGIEPVEPTENKWKQVREPKPEVSSEQSVKEAQGTEEKPHSEKQDSQSLNAAMEEENQALKRRLQYAEAELQNMLRRHREGLEKTRQYAGVTTIEAFFPLLDSLEVANDALTEENDQKEANGRQNILDLMYTIFKKLGVTSIDPLVTESFDPNLHSAVAAEVLSDNSQAVNTIVRVVRKGYRLHDRIIRPAMVIISTTKES